MGPLLCSCGIQPYNKNILSLGVTKYSSPVQSCSRLYWAAGFGHPYKFLSQQAEKKLRSEVFKVVRCFPLLILAGWSWQQVKPIDVLSALQSTHARAGERPDSPTGQPSAFHSIRSIFPQKKENHCCSRHEGCWPQPDRVSVFAPAHRKTFININRSRNKTAT